MKRISDAEIKRLKDELKVGNYLHAKLTDQCRELEMKIKEMFESLDSMCDIPEHNIIANLKVHPKLKRNCEQCFEKLKREYLNKESEVKQ